MKTSLSTCPPEAEVERPGRLLEEISLEFAAELALSPDGKERCPDGKSPFRWKAQRVLGLVEPLIFGQSQPKLEWHGPWLMLGNLAVARAFEEKDGWHAKIGDNDEPAGPFADREVARAAVAESVRNALWGKANGGRSCNETDIVSVITAYDALVDQAAAILAHLTDKLDVSEPGCARLSANDGVVTVVWPESEDDGFVILEESFPLDFLVGDVGEREKTMHAGTAANDRQLADAAWAYFQPLIGHRVRVKPYIFEDVGHLHQGPMEVVDVKRRPRLDRPWEFSPILSVVMRLADGSTASICHTDVNWRVPAVTERA